MSDTSQPPVTISDFVAAVQAIAAQQDNSAHVLDLLSQVRDGLNGVDFTLVSSVMTSLGQLSDMLTAIDTRFDTLEQRINTMSGDLTSNVATLKADFADLASVVTNMHSGLSDFEAQFAAKIAELQAQNTMDATAMADLAALHQMAVDLKNGLAADVASIPTSAAPSGGDTGSTGATAPAPTGSTGDTGASGATAPAPTGSTGDTGGASGSTAAAPTGSTGDTGATAAPPTTTTSP